MRKLAAAGLVAASAACAFAGAANADMTLRFNRWIPATHFTQADWLDVWGAESHVYNNKHQIKSMEDFKGLKIRSATSMVAEVLKRFGATPILAPVN